MESLNLVGGGNHVHQGGIQVSTPVSKRGDFLICNKLYEKGSLGNTRPNTGIIYSNLQFFLKFCLVGTEIGYALPVAENDIEMGVIW